MDRSVNPAGLDSDGFLDAGTPASPRRERGGLDDGQPFSVDADRGEPVVAESSIQAPDHQMCAVW